MKEETKSLLEKKHFKTIMIVLIVAAAIIIILLIIMHWWKKKKQAQKEEDERLEQILSQPLSTFGNAELHDLGKKYDVVVTVTPVDKAHYTVAAEHKHTDSSSTTDSKGGTYDVFTGPTQKMNAMVQYMGYILTGHECALFVPDDGWENLKELFDEIKMAPAESYDFICSDEYTEEIAAADLENCKIYVTENGTIDATSIAYPKYGLTSIRYIVPHGVTKESEPVEGINQIVVMPNADGILDVEAPELLNYGGTLYAAYPVAEVLKKAGIETTTAKAISYKDGYIFDYDIDTFMKVYFCLDTKNKNDAFTCGKAQVRDQLCKAAGQYIFDDAALVYVPGVEVMPDGYSVPDLFKAVGMVEAKAYKFTCADGWAEEIDAEDLANVKIFINAAGDGVDATSIAYPDNTLMNILEITPVA